MDITYRIDKDTIYIVVEGRIDASNVSMAEEKIFDARNENKDKHIVIDAEKLEYISSAGLRVVLKLRKEDPELAIINVTSEVYEIFDMTGFTEMVTVEKAYPVMSIEGCEFIAKGANGAVYRYDDETILKIYFAKDALPEIKQERENARRAFVMGINTAIPYGIVRVGDLYGTVTELLNAVSVTKLIRKNTDDMIQAAKYNIDMLKNIHSIEVKDGIVPDMREIALSWIGNVKSHLEEEQVEKLRTLLEGIPKVNNMLHGDYHTNNIMIQNGEAVLIDMDTLCMGHPVFEIASMFNAFVGYGEINEKNIFDFYGFSYETAGKFWDMSLKMYLGTDDEAVCQSVAEKAMVIGYTRMLRRAIRLSEDPESPAKIARCQEMLGILLNKIDTLVF